MKNKIWLALSLFSIIFVAGCAEIRDEKIDSLAQCLTKNEIKMYGTEWCSHCQDQKKAFGPALEFIEFVDCDKYSFECKSAGVESYPTWIINDQKYLGNQPLERLAALSGCEYK